MTFFQVCCPEGRKKKSKVKISYCYPTDLVTSLDKNSHASAIYLCIPTGHEKTDKNTVDRNLDFVSIIMLTLSLYNVIML